MAEEGDFEHAALRESEARFESIVDNSLAVIYVKDKDGRFLFVNRRFEILFHLDRAAVLGKTDYDLFPRGLAGGFRANDRQVIESGTALEVEEVAPQDDGLHTYLSIKFPLRDAAGDIHAVCGMSSDITDHKRSEEALRQSEARLASIIASAMDAIITVDTAQRILTFNPAAERMFGYRADEVLGWPLDLLLPERFRASHMAHIQRFGHSGVTTRSMGSLGVLLARRKDGAAFPIEATISQAAVGGQTLYTAIVRDITERQHLETEREARHEKDRRIAESLQRSLLLAPPEEQFAGLSVATVYEAAWDEASVGGDFFDLFALDEGKVALVIGDASGKGLAAATRTAEVKYALRAFLREYPDTGRGLSRLNGHICDSLRLDWQGSFGFITLCLAILDPSRGKVDLSMGGSEPPCLVRAGGGIEVVDPKISGLPLGIEASEDYAVMTLPLRSGDTLLMLTDGITEARRGRTDFFGYERVAHLAGETCAGALRETGRAILEAAREFAGGALGDDVCLLLARRK